MQTFIENMLAPLRQGVPQVRMPRLDELLAQGVKELDSTGGSQPATHSELLVMLARTYDRMGDIDTARTLAQRAYRYSTEAFGRADPRTVQALAMRGRMHARFGDRELARADLEAARAQMQRGGFDGVALAMVLDDLGFLQLELDRPVQAAGLFAEAQERRRRELGAKHPDIAIGYANKAQVENARGDKPSALRLYQQAYRHCATYEGPDTRQAAIYLSRTGLTQCELGHWRDGARDYIRALAIFDRIDQRDHPERFNILKGGCSAWVFLDELAQAESDCDQAVAMAARMYGEDSHSHLYALRTRLKLLAAQGRLQEARAEADRQRAILRAAPGDHRRELAGLGRFLSDAQVVEGDYAGLRDSLIEPVLTNQFGEVPIVPSLIARLALTCAHAPAPRCPGDLVARADAKMAEPFHRRHPLRIEALLALARLALKQGDGVRAHARLDDIQALAALPHARLRPGATAGWPRPVCCAATPSPRRATARAQRASGVPRRPCSPPAIPPTIRSGASWRRGCRGSRWCTDPFARWRLAAPMSDFPSCWRLGGQGRHPDGPCPSNRRRT